MRESGRRAGCPRLIRRRVVLGTRAYAAQRRSRIIEVCRYVAGIELDRAGAAIHRGEGRTRGAGVGAVIDTSVVADQQPIGVVRDERAHMVVDVHGSRVARGRLVVAASEIGERVGAVGRTPQVGRTEEHGLWVGRIHQQARVVVFEQETVAVRIVDATVREVGRRRRAVRPAQAAITGTIDSTARGLCIDHRLVGRRDGKIYALQRIATAGVGWKATGASRRPAVVRA